MTTSIPIDLYSYRDGEIIFSEGDAAHYAYLVQSGMVEICKKEMDGSVHILARLPPGKLFGEMALIDGKPRSATARAVGPTRLVPVSEASMTEKIHNSPRLVQELLLNLTTSLRSLLD